MRFAEVPVCCMTCRREFRTVTNYRRHACVRRREHFRRTFTLSMAMLYLIRSGTMVRLLERAAALGPVLERGTRPLLEPEIRRIQDTKREDLPE